MEMLKHTNQCRFCKYCLICLRVAVYYLSCHDSCLVSLVQKSVIHFDLQLNEMLEEKVRPYIQNMDNGVIPPPIVMQSPKNQDHKVLL